MVVASALSSKFKVTGHICVCVPNWIYVQQGIYDQFCQRLVEEVEKFHVGDALQDNSVTHRPMTNGVSKVEEHIRDAVNKGAKVLLDGNRLPSLGKNFHELTILGDVNNTMHVASEETFGPVAALFKFLTEDEVVDQANKCDVGLASYVMTSDLVRSH